MPSKRRATWRSIALTRVPAYQRLGSVGKNVSRRLNIVPEPATMFSSRSGPSRCSMRATSMAVLPLPTIQTGLLPSGRLAIRPDSASGAVERTAALEIDSGGLGRTWLPYALINRLVVSVSIRPSGSRTVTATVPPASACSMYSQRNAPRDPLSSAPRRRSSAGGRAPRRGSPGGRQACPAARRCSHW